MLISIIAAMDKNFLIGKDNHLPWYLPADLRYFKDTTMGKPILMGRTTCESIQKPLPGRLNLVLTRQTNFNVAGFTGVSSLDEALKQVVGGDELFVVGGAKVYASLMPRVDRLYLTLIDEAFVGDTYFPAIDLNQWKIIKEDAYLPDEKNAYPYRFLVFERAS